MEKEKISSELKSQFLRLYHMATTDSEFSPLELKALYEFASIRDVSQDELDNYLLNPVGKMNAPESLEKKIEALYDLCLMIYADGVVTKEERSTLEKFCLKFGFVEENVEGICEYLLESAKNNVARLKIINELK